MSFRKSFDLLVYFVLDPTACAGRDPVDVARSAIAGGVTMLQLRVKTDDHDYMLGLAQQILPLTRAAGIPLLINDYVDIALKCGADGVHLGQGDMPAETARKFVGEGAIIGVTAFEPSHFQSINPEIVDYAGTGPFYPTETKKGKPVLGAKEFAALVKISPVPVVGIGGITPDNFKPVLEAGADGVAMMRSVSEAADPQGAARSFRS